MHFDNTVGNIKFIKISMPITTLEYLALNTILCYEQVIYFLFYMSHKIYEYT